MFCLDIPIQNQRASLLPMVRITALAAFSRDAERNINLFFWTVVGRRLVTRSTWIQSCVVIRFTGTLSLTGDGRMAALCKCVSSSCPGSSFLFSPFSSRPQLHLLFWKTALLKALRGINNYILFLFLKFRKKILI